MFFNNCSDFFLVQPHRFLHHHYAAPCIDYISALVEAFFVNIIYLYQQDSLSIWASWEGTIIVMKHAEFLNQ